jgi:hypothetical protein
MANPTLTHILIAMLIGLFAMTTVWSSYQQFMTDNAITLNGNFTNTYNNITDIYNETQGIGYSMTDDTSGTGPLRRIWEGAANTFLIGLSSIGMFFEMIPLIGNLFSTIGNVVPGFRGLLGLFTLVITIYIAMSYIRAVRGTNYNP